MKFCQDQNVMCHLYVCVCQCDVLIEQYEEVIEDWYKGSQEEDLTTYLCEKHVLKGQDAGKTSSTFRISKLLDSLILFFPASNDMFIFLNHTTYLLASACLGEQWDHRKKKGDPAAIAEDKKKKKKKGAKKGKGKTEEGEEGRGDGGSEGEKAAKKKNEKKVKKKKKSKVPVQKADGGLTSDEEVQPQVPLPRHKTEL